MGGLTKAQEGEVSREHVDAHYPTVLLERDVCKAAVMGECHALGLEPIGRVVHREACESSVRPVLKP